MNQKIPSVWVGSEEGAIVGRKVWGRGAPKLHSISQVTLALAAWHPVGTNLAVLLALAPVTTVWPCADSIPSLPVP